MKYRPLECLVQQMYIRICKNWEKNNIQIWFFKVSIWFCVFLYKTVLFMERTQCEKCFTLQTFGSKWKNQKNIWLVQFFLFKQIFYRFIFWNEYKKKEFERKWHKKYVVFFNKK